MVGAAQGGPKFISIPWARDHRVDTSVNQGHLLYPELLGLRWPEEDLPGVSAHLGATPPLYFTSPLPNESHAVLHSHIASFEFS